eukprot:768797-Hanusia_phi.AAC.2
MTPLPGFSRTVAVTGHRRRSVPSHCDAGFNTRRDDRRESDGPRRRGPPPSGDSVPGAALRSLIQWHRHAGFQLGNH